MSHFGKELDFSGNTFLGKLKGDFAGKTVIFLDIDGVLNCKYSKERICGYIGIEDEKVERLKRIAEYLDADIVLSSSWKAEWFKEDKDIQGEMGNYLDEKLNRQGLHIIDRTYDSGWNRGKGINSWIREHGPLKAFVILDDERFDFFEERLIKHWVRTAYARRRGGLQEKHVKEVQKNIEKYLAENL